ncbi:MAG: hypothetical protein SWE60_09350 [Thermodesulfobacteriota bacterium]|nr:hypothetical protein [Thermodesulfobacteriota bacterium]
MKKRAFILISVLIMSLAATPALALDPVTYPDEGYVIMSATAVELEGDLIVAESYSQEVCSTDGEAIVTVLDDCCDEGDIVFQGPININAGFIGYREESDALDGMVSLRKDFTALGQPHDSSDNVVVNKDVGYVATGPIGRYAAEEAGGLSVWQGNGVAVHWDLVNQGGAESIRVTAGPDNRKERHVAMGSGIFATSISAHTDTDFNLLGNRVTASYDIGAVGEGIVGADLITRYNELDMANMKHEEHTTADGVFAFTKNMDVFYDQEPESVDPFDTLSPLCPFNQGNEVIGIGAAQPE